MSDATKRNHSGKDFRSFQVGGVVRKSMVSRRYEDASHRMAARKHWDAQHSPEAKQAHAEVLRKERETRSPSEQLALLDSRLGVGIGAVKERKRLNEQICVALRIQEEKDRKVQAKEAKEEAAKKKEKPAARKRKVSA